MHRAYAKINLGLLILDGHPDGYHSIETVFHRINLSDEISFQPASGITLTTDDPRLPTDERNICLKAALLLRQELGAQEGVRITLRKIIPSGAGLGGGSSDAGVVLRYLPQFWGKAVGQSTLQQLALLLGSDVPYFLGNGSALARGRGELLDYFPLDIPYTILVCYPNIHVSTAWAYQALPARRVAPRIDLQGVVRAGLSEPIRLVNGLRNDFEPVVFSTYPEIMRVKEAMMRGGAEYASLSGSGSAVYGLFARASYAHELSAYFAAKGYQAFLTRPHFTPE
jgi:4-diphosphocytidyl-2-C-methyl-D-erythritol kinase